MYIMIKLTRRGGIRLAEDMMLRLPVRFVSAGQFEATGHWLHPDRVLGTSVIIVVERGCFGICVGQRQYTVRAGQALLLPAGHRHLGVPVEGTEPPVYYWAHFESGGSLYGDALVFDALQLDLPEPALNRLVFGFHQLINENSMGMGRSQICDYMLSILLLELRQEAREAPRTAVASRMLEYIRLHCYEKLTLRDLAGALGYTEDYLSRLFHESAGCSFRQYIHRMRIQRAKRELLSGVKTIQQIAVECGYSNPKFFSTVFLKSEGMPPSTYRNLYSGQHQNNA